MDRLTLEHLAPYLPYGLEVMYRKRISKIMLCDIHTRNYVQLDKFTHDWNCTLDKIKPILRPLSDLTKEIEHKGATFVPIHRILEAYCFDVSKMTEFEISEYVDSLIEIDISYMTAKFLFEWHFDVFGLIDGGLAIDINTIKT